MSQVAGKTTLNGKYRSMSQVAGITTLNGKYRSISQVAGITTLNGKYRSMSQLTRKKINKVVFYWVKKGNTKLKIIHSHWVRGLVPGEQAQHGPGPECERRSLEAGWPAHLPHHQVGGGAAPPPLLHRGCERQQTSLRLIQSRACTQK